MRGIFRMSDFAFTRQTAISATFDNISVSGDSSLQLPGHMEPILESIFESAVDGIVVIDARGSSSVQPRRRATVRLWRRTRSWARTSAADAEPRPRTARPISRELSGTGVPRIIGTGRDVRGRRKDGSTFPFIFPSAETEIDGKPAFTGILHDLSRRVEIEESLRKSEERVRSIVESAVDAHHRDRRTRRRPGVQPVSRAALRLPAQRSAWAQRQHADAKPRSRTARRLPAALSHDRRAEHHRHRPRGDRAASKDGTTFPVHLSVGEMVTRRQAQLYRHPARPERSRCARAAACRAEVAREARRNGGGRCA